MFYLFLSYCSSVPNSWIHAKSFISFIFYTVSMYYSSFRITFIPRRKKNIEIFLRSFANLLYVSVILHRTSVTVLRLPVLLLLILPNVRQSSLLWVLFHLVCPTLGSHITLPLHSKFRNIHTHNSMLILHCPPCQPFLPTKPL